MTIPYAFGMAALITGHLDDSWLRAVRRWTMIGWLFLSFGLTLGMLWAYEELGWGGFWGWDPVENAGLLPWFTATAFLHSVMVQERRGMLRVWNVTLVITTFFLTIFGTFMTRSGVVQSVHAFGEDKKLAMMFTIFMVTILTVSFGLVIYRLPLLRSRNELDSWVSREAAFLANNWILLFSAFFVLFATMFPTLSEAVNGRAADRRAAVLQQVDAAGRADAAAADRHRSAAGVAQVVGRRTWSTSSCGRRSPRWSPARRCWRSAMRAVGQRHLLRAVRVRDGHDRAGVRARRVRAQGRHRLRSADRDDRPGRRARSGATAATWSTSAWCWCSSASPARASRRKSRRCSSRARRFRSAASRCATMRSAITSDSQKQMVTGHVTVSENGKVIGELTPARWFFNKHEEEPTTEVAIRRAAGEDLYVVLASYDASAQTATYAVTVNPLVDWIWIGFGVIALGTGLALMPETVF